MRTLSLIALCLGSFWVIGCAKPDADAKSDKSAKTTDAAEIPEPAHGHPDKGPNGGKLIELGEEEFHGEMVHDKANQTVTIYVLDSTAKKAVPIDAKEVSIGAEKKTYALMAQPLDGETMGKSSRFSIKDETLSEVFGSGHYHAKLILTIGEQPFSVTIDSH